MLAILPTIAYNARHDDKFFSRYKTGMNTFRTFSESRSFISLSLLLLLITMYAPVCHAETGSVGVDHHQNHSSSDDQHDGVFGHTDETPEHCCSDLSAPVNTLPPAVVSSIGLDLDHALPDAEPLTPIPDDADGASVWRNFHFETARLSVYLLTGRLRI